MQPFRDSTNFPAEYANSSDQTKGFQSAGSVIIFGLLAVPAKFYTLFSIPVQLYIKNPGHLQDA